MTKVYPGAISTANHPTDEDHQQMKLNPTVLTVWKKSLLFNSDGFTVLDANGKLVYRVDNYVFGSDIILMDASGKSLLTIHRKKRSMTWSIFNSETTDNPMFLVKKNANLLNTNKCLAHVSSVKGQSKNWTPCNDEVLYEIEGSFARRCCAINDANRRRVAEIKRKETSVRGVDLGMDIFSLVIEQGFDPTIVMALVIVLDQMFGSSTSRRSRLLTYYCL